MNTVASLPAKWRAKSRAIAKPYGFVTEHVLGKAQALDACADDLEAALASPAGEGGLLFDDGSLTYAGQRKVVEHMTTELGAAIGILQKVQQRAEAIDCQPLATPEQPAIDIDACVDRFLGWRLPDDFAPDDGISFTPITNPAWLHDNWPIGTNLLTAVQARAMLEYVLNWTAGAPSAQQPLDGPANNAGVATGSRNGPPSESVTRGNPPSNLEQPGSSVQGAVYVEARECSNCEHIGINDSHETDAACHDCEWSGPSPVEDKCPGCGNTGCMTAACPDCGSRYRLAASLDITTPPPAPAAEQGKAARDALIYGSGYMVGGKHVPVEQVSITLPPKPEARGVEGRVREFLTRTKVPGKDYLYCIKPKELDALFDTTNPVRAEQPEGKGASFADGVKACIAWVVQRRHNFEEEYGSTDPTTNAMEFGSVEREEYDCELVEIEEGLRKLLAAAPAAPGAAVVAGRIEAMHGALDKAAKAVSRLCAPMPTVPELAARMRGVDEARTDALYDELFCTGKFIRAAVPIDPKAIIRETPDRRPRWQGGCAMTESFDAVLAKLAEVLPPKPLGDVSAYRFTLTATHAAELHNRFNRLAAAHAAEVGELRNEIARRTNEALRQQAERLTAHCRAEAAEQDARRYRWLRDAEAGALDRPFIGYRNSNGFSQFVGEYADTAIDSAIAAQQKEAANGD